MKCKDLHHLRRLLEAIRQIAKLKEADMKLIISEKLVDWEFMSQAEFIANKKFMTKLMKLDVPKDIHIKVEII